VGAPHTVPLGVRTLLVTTRGAGHFGPLLPFADALALAGADLLVAVPRSGVAMVEGAGLTAWPLDEPPDEERTAIFQAAHGLPTDEGNALVLREVFGGMDARASLPGVREAIGSWAPDLVLFETASFAAPLAAEGAGLPAIHVAIGLARLIETFLPHVVEPLGALRNDSGLAPDPDGERLLATPFFTLTPEGLEDAAAPDPPVTHRFREPEGDPGALPDWWPDRDLPLVYLTFGSVAPSIPGFADLARAAIGAVADRPVRALLTVGRQTDPADLGPVPPNVRVERWVPQADVMPHAAAMVCHGGFGTVRAGLAAGIPMVVLPLFADQPYNARRVAEIGAGIALEGGPEAAAGLGEAIERILAEPSYRAEAARVAERHRRLPPVEAAVDAARDLVAGAAGRA
jgi:UDP:flavonoid glycosyltransferase YjiC (YdhE family)